MIEDEKAELILAESAKFETRINQLIEIIIKPPVIIYLSDRNAQIRSNNEFHELSAFDPEFQIGKSLISSIKIISNASCL